MRLLIGLIKSCILFPCRSILLITYGWRPESPWPLICWVSGTCPSANTDKNDIVTAYALVRKTSFELLLARAHMDSKDRRKIRCLQYICNLGLSHRFHIHQKKAELSFAMIGLLKLQWIFHNGYFISIYLLYSSYSFSSHVSFFPFVLRVWQ